MTENATPPRGAVYIYSPRRALEWISPLIFRAGKLTTRPASAPTVFNGTENDHGARSVAPVLACSASPIKNQTEGPHGFAFRQCTARQKEWAQVLRCRTASHQKRRQLLPLRKIPRRDPPPHRVNALKYLADLVPRGKLWNHSTAVIVRLCVYFNTRRIETAGRLGAYHSDA